MRVNGNGWYRGTIGNDFDGLNVLDVAMFDFTRVVMVTGLGRTGALKYEKDFLLSVCRGEDV